MKILFLFVFLIFSLTNTILAKNESSFVNLLNGKDLSGWNTNGNWLVQKDGSLMIDPLPEQKGWKRFDDYIFTEKKFADFILEMEYKYPAKGNSGLFFRVGDTKNPVHTGIEVQILECFGQKDQTMTHHDHGGIIKFRKPKRNMSKKPGEWNHMIVSCEGHHLRVAINGVEVQNVYLDDDADEGLPPSKLNTRPMRGHIGLQDHGVPHRLFFRNIKILEL